MRYKRKFTKHEECMLKLNGGISMLPEFWHYLHTKELLLFSTLVEHCQSISIGEKYITFNYNDCTMTNANLAKELNWSLTTVIKWSNALEKLGVISTKRKSHSIVRSINSKEIYELQKRIGRTLLRKAFILREICGNKPISQITDNDIELAYKNVKLLK